MKLPLSHFVFFLTSFFTVTLDRDVNNATSDLELHYTVQAPVSLGVFVKAEVPVDLVAIGTSWQWERKRSMPS